MLFVMVVGVQTWRTWDVPTGVAPDFTAPARTSSTDLSSPPESLNFAQWRTLHKGQAVALHFWAQWCPVCKLEEPMVDALAADWPVLTVATQSGNIAVVQKTLAQRGRNWQVVSDPTGHISRQYGLNVLPAWVIVDPQGHIHTSTTGYTTVWGLQIRLWWASLVSNKKAPSAFISSDSSYSFDNYPAADAASACPKRATPS
jgi:thiol-disulfide isomerase/thioredoxin